jgi:hypothetical protein
MTFFASMSVKSNFNIHAKYEENLKEGNKEYPQSRYGLLILRRDM